MIGRGLFALTILSNCVVSLPLTPSQLENEDVQVIKCIVEALADVLSRPHPTPVSQECLVTLRTDDRLVAILRHHNFLKELQEIAVQGDHERAKLQGDADTPDPMTPAPPTTASVPDRSMLEALGGPGERSILSQKRRAENGESPRGEDSSEEDTDSAEDQKEKRESEDESSEGTASKRKEEEEEEEEEKRANSEEENMKDKKDAGAGEKRNAARNKSHEKTADEEEKNKRFALFSHKKEEKPEEQEDKHEGEAKRAGWESPKRWTKRGKALPMKRKEGGKESQQHHSKEVSEEEEKRKKKSDFQRSPEEKELQMIARRGPEEKRGMEEEGSGSRKSEEPEIESLAAIESELENVAQKLHELRRG